MMSRRDDRVLWDFLNRFRQDGGDALYDAEAVAEASRNVAMRKLDGFMRRHAREDGGVFRVPVGKVEEFCGGLSLDAAGAPRRGPSPLQSLSAVKVAEIDVEEARRHFDLPIEDQMGRGSVRGHLSGTKKALLALFRGRREIEVWRGMDVPDGWVDGLRPGAPLGSCWAWSEDGAMRGSGFDARASLDDGSVILRGRVSPENVDWSTTIAVNAFSEGENEIVLLPWAVVALDSVVRLRTRTEMLGEGMRGLPFASGGEDVEPEGPSPG